MISLCFYSLAAGDVFRRKYILIDFGVGFGGIVLMRWDYEAFVLVLDGLFLEAGPPKLDEILFQKAMHRLLST